MLRSFLQRAALALAGVVGLLGTSPATANAQKALVYCPVTVDATGCNAIVNALTGSAFPLGVDRGYDGTGGTVDLKAVDLFSYAVFVVPSLADGSASQPYALLRDPDVVGHLKAALIGRVAMWSGTPDQGATNRVMKDALIQNLAGWAAGAYATAKGPGLVTFLDASASVVSRYDWVRAIAPLPVTADANLLIYNSVRALNARATSILTSGAGPITYTNMATYGFQVPNGAAGVSLDAVGQTGTTVGGQVVLLTMEAGNSAGATVKTDKDDYAPGEVVTITGTGWQAGEAIKLTLHMDPVRDSDTELTATVDGSGSFINTEFSPASYDVGVRFVLTALGQSSGRRAQTTFTDGNKVTFSATAVGAETNSFGTVAANQCVNAFVQERQGGNLDNAPAGGRVVTLTSSPSGPAFFAGAGCSGSPTTTVTLAGGTSNVAFSFLIAATGTFNLTGTGAGLSGTGNAATASVAVGSTAPTASDDSYSTSEDQSLTIPAPGVLNNDAGTGALSASIVNNVPPAAGSVTLNANGGFTYTPAANFNGSTSFTYRAENGGGSSAPATVSIVVSATNDAPSFTKGANEAVLEDSGPRTANGWATGISAGAPDEAGQTLTFNVTNDNNLLFSVQPSIASDGTLSYTPAPNQHGSVTVTVTLSDNGGGTNTSAAQTFTITVTPVNDAPSFTKGSDQSVNEDAAAQIVPGWATAISAGPFETQGLTFQVGTDNPSLFSAGPAISSTGELTYTLAPNANGAANVTVTLEDDGGTANGGIDTSAPQGFKITVNAVNDVPSFTKGADQAVLEDTGPHTVAAWATAISTGPANESGQAVTFAATNDNNALFTAGGQPTITADGTLTYTLAPNRYGNATVTVTLSDDGGTMNGGDDTSDPQTFTITINPVNDEPSFTKGDNQSVLEDAAAQTVNGWATAISAGPFETQTLTFTVTNDNNALFAAQPAISPTTGTLTYQLAPNAFGSATISVVLTDDGGTANGGDNTSTTETFTITVTPVNDAPTYDLITSTSSAEDDGQQTVGGAVSAMTVGPSNEAPPQTLLSLTTSNNNTSLFTMTGQPTIALATGELTYTAAPNANGTATVTVVLKDNGGTANGGVDQTTKTFTIVVTKVNDAPEINSFTGPAAPVGAGSTIQVNGSFTDVDLGDVPMTESHTVTIDWGDGTPNTTNPALSGGGTTRSLSANHTYPNPGVYTVTLTVTDAANETATATYRYVVVYDPNAGFVTGGGWIMSPAGAYLAQPTLTGKATFGFVSKYKKGQTVPDGNTEFQFHAASFNFKSTAYEWLVVAGSRAQFKGTGTVNGSGNYGFILTAIDGQISGGGGIDKFRMKVWNIDTNTIVYDNQPGASDDTNTPITTTLGGGSINIQAK